MVWVARVAEVHRRRARPSSFPPRSGFVQVEISGVPAAINARKTLCVGSAYNENRTDTKDLLVLDKTRYQSNAVVQPLAAQSGSSLSQQNSAPVQVSAVLSEGTSRISVRSRWRREKGTSLISTVREGKEPQEHARKRLMQAA